MFQNKKPLLPHLASYEELLKALSESAAQEEQVTEILEYNNNVVPFLSHYNIQPGNYPVSKRLLYKLYKNHVDLPLENNSFQRVVSEYLPFYENRNGKFYKINLDQFKVSEYIIKKLNDKKVVKEKSPSYRKHFENFLKQKNIEAGNFWVESFVIYEIYLEFNRNRKKRPLFSYKSFHSMLKTYFKNQRRTSSRVLWFRVNESTSNYFTQEQIDDIKARRSTKKRQEE